MVTATSPPTNAIELVRQLNPDEIRAHLAVVSGERKALLILLRAALAASRSKQTVEPRGGQCA